MSSERLWKQDGGSLAESLVAIGLFAISAAVIGQLLMQHVRLQGGNSTATTAIALAAQELEDLRALDYSDMVTRSGTVTAGAITYNVQTTVVPDSPEPNLKNITTSVSWTEPAGPKVYTTYVIFSDITR